VLGDERFVETVTCRAAPTPALSARPRRVAFAPLLRAVATVHRMTPRAMLAPGRQRAPVPARAMLVFLAREWGALTTGELGRRLRRDPLSAPML
jgi:chromosomal replication initiation ATPase DnaA